MLNFWNNCKLGVKLQSAFALVMLLFIAALAGVYTTLVPARAAINISEIDSTAHALHEQAEHLEGLVARFIFEESRQSPVDAPRKLAARRAVSLRS